MVILQSTLIRLSIRDLIGEDGFEDDLTTLADLEWESFGSGNDDVAEAVLSGCTSKDLSSRFWQWAPNVLRPSLIRDVRDRLDMRPG